MLDKKELQRDFVPRPELLGVSNLAYLPTKAPEHLLYSIEATGGKKTIIDINGTIIGGPEVILIAGSCSLENSDQIKASAIAAKMAGAKGLRGGSLKPRTSPYSFQGNGEMAAKIQRECADKLNMFVVMEVTGENNLDMVLEYADTVQVGARNFQNFELLVAIGIKAGKLGKSVLYKRGVGGTTEEWLMGAEYLMAAGCPDVILCEARVGHGNESIDCLRKMTHLPIICDPTHSVKKSNEVPDLAVNCIESGTDGLIIETHPNPELALSDGKRALLPEELAILSNRISDHLPIGRTFSSYE